MRQKERCRNRNAGRVPLRVQDRRNSPERFVAARSLLQQAHPELGINESFADRLKGDTDIQQVINGAVPSESDDEG
jgi:hypothetical protein